MTKRFFAEWDEVDIPEGFDLDEIYISAGVVNEQVEGYFASDTDAHLTINRGKRSYFIRLTVPTKGLENENGYWLSPNLLFDKHEATDCGLI